MKEYKLGTLAEIIYEGHLRVTERNNSCRRTFRVTEEINHE
jgi:hypothetical protein